MSSEENDNQLQEQVEQGSHRGLDIDGKVYEVVFRVLKKEPEFVSIPSFTNKIIARIHEAKARKALRKDFLWLGLGLFSFVVATLFVMVQTNFKISPGAFTFISSYSTLLWFGLLLIAGLLWIERQILPKNQKQV